MQPYNESYADLVDDIPTCSGEEACEIVQDILDMSQEQVYLLNMEEENKQLKAENKHLWDKISDIKRAIHISHLLLMHSTNSRDSVTMGYEHEELDEFISAVYKAKEELNNYSVASYRIQ
jgi:ribosomal protein L24